MDVEDFVNGIDKELAHRKLELSRLKIKIVQEAGDLDSDHASWMRRSAAVLSYAHWEGFVKRASIRYVRYLNSQDLPISSLKCQLQAACLVSHFKRARESVKVRYLGEVLRDIDEARQGIFRVDPGKVVDTESNLTSTVFADLVEGIGLNYLDEYKTRGPFIDTKLVYGRHQVAHGELASFSATEIVDRIEAVVRLLDQYSQQLFEAVRDRLFLEAIQLDGHEPLGQRDGVVPAPRGSGLLASEARQVEVGPCDDIEGEVSAGSPRVV
ncbi:MAE_28990/MAE_18760 family HEPN-like nuclease [Micromonospora parva]|uniref:MAE_28990/MAE_18760 family HEPN-like nuclease n=1 Tax=Micromonospora parva TaxID=1464048 RepID=UPI00365C06E9